MTAPKIQWDLPRVTPGQPLWSYIRTAVRIGPFGPNSTDLMTRGGSVSLTPAEAEHIEAAVREWLSVNPGADCAQSHWELKA